MTKKKAKPAKPAPVEAPAEASGEEVESEPAIVEEAFIQVRGTSVGGTVMMTQSEHDEYCKGQAKKK